MFQFETVGSQSKVRRVSVRWSNQRNFIFTALIYGLALSLGSIANAGNSTQALKTSAKSQGNYQKNCKYTADPVFAEFKCANGEIGKIAVNFNFPGAVTKDRLKMGAEIFQGRARLFCRDHLSDLEDGTLYQYKICDAHRGPIKILESLGWFQSQADKKAVIEDKDDLFDKQYPIFWLQAEGKIKSFDRSKVVIELKDGNLKDLDNSVFSTIDKVIGKVVTVRSTSMETMFVLATSVPYAKPKAQSR